MNRKIIYPLLALALAVMGCSFQSTPSSPTDTAPVVPASTQATLPPLPTDTSVPPTPAGLTIGQLRNGTYFAPFYGKTVTLSDGSYSTGTGADYYSVQMLDLVAFGDLNGDGIQDAAVLLVESGGGSGEFVSVVAVADAGGAPSQIGQAQLGDRVMVDHLAITSATLSMDMLVAGPNDPMCCPSQSESQSYQLVGNTLWLTRLTSLTPDNQERSITVNSPGDGSAVSNPFTVSGNVTIAPFENTLASRLYLPDGTLVNEAPVMVDSGGTMGGPGTFSRILDLGNAGITGPVILQFLDLSAADGSTLALGSVMLTVK